MPDSAIVALERGGAHRRPQQRVDAHRQEALRAHFLEEPVVGDGDRRDDGPW